MLGSANFKGGPLLHILSGNLGFQIEHHLFPDLPSNRYAEISVKVRALCEKYDLPYTTGPLHRQYGQALRTIIKLSLPNGMTSSDQPEPPTPVARAQAPDRRRAPGAAYRAGRLVAERGRSARMMATTPFAWGDSLDDLVGKRVTQCALSRICGVCGEPLGRPIAFVGTAARGRPQRLPPPAAAHRLCATSCAGCPVPTPPGSS